MIALAGQSNTHRHGSVTGLPAADKQPFAGVKILVGTSYQPLQMGVNHHGNAGATSELTLYGPEYQLAKDWEASNPNGCLYISKNSEGNTSLSQDWAPGSGLRSQLLFDLQIAVDSLPSMPTACPLPKIGFAWYQGETDSNNSNFANAYQENEGKLFADVRSVLGANVPIANMQIPNNDNRPFGSVVQAAKSANANADPLITLVQTAGLSQLADMVHFDDAGQQAIGSQTYDILCPREP